MSFIFHPLITTERPPYPMTMDEVVNEFLRLNTLLPLDKWLTNNGQPALLDSDDGSKFDRWLFLGRLDGTERTPFPPQDTRPLGTTQTDCVICQEALNETDRSQIPCGHVFHRDCVLSWFRGLSEIGDFNRHCPLCRTAMYGAPHADLFNDDNRKWWPCLTSSFLEKWETVTSLVAQQRAGGWDLHKSLAHIMLAADRLAVCRWHVFRKFEKNPMKQLDMSLVRVWLERCLSDCFRDTHLWNHRDDVLEKFVETFGCLSEGDTLFKDSFSDAEVEIEREYPMELGLLQNEVHTLMLPSKLYHYVRLTLESIMGSRFQGSRYLQLLAGDVAVCTLRQGESCPEFEWEYEDDQVNPPDDSTHDTPQHGALIYNGTTIRNGDAWEVDDEIATQDEIAMQDGDGDALQDGSLIQDETAEEDEGEVELPKLPEETDEFQWDVDEGSDDIYDDRFLFSSQVNEE